MTLSPFVAKKVNPGEPVTAQAWNDIVEALEGLSKEFLAERLLVKVKVSGGPSDTRTTRVTAASAEGALFAAVGPITTGGSWVFTGLAAGVYNVVAEAPGYVSATGSVTVDGLADASLELALSAAGPFMPELFGIGLGAARAQLATAGISLLALWDASGEALVPTTADADHDPLPVIGQSPAAGSVILAGAGAKLVVAAPERDEAIIEVPSLTGMTQVEVQKTLEKLGLVLGVVDNRER